MNIIATLIILLILTLIVLVANSFLPCGKPVAPQRVVKGRRAFFRPVPVQPPKVTVQAQPKANWTPVSVGTTIVGVIGALWIGGILLFIAMVALIWEFGPMLIRSIFN